MSKVKCSWQQVEAIGIPTEHHHVRPVRYREHVKAKGKTKGGSIKVGHCVSTETWGDTSFEYQAESPDDKVFRNGRYVSIQRYNQKQR